MSEILYGRIAVMEALRARRRKVHRLLLARGVKSTGIIAEILALCQRSGIPAQSLPRQKLDEIVSDSHHQGVAAQIDSYPYLDVEDILDEVERRGEMPFLLLLDCIQDPQNFGALLRTADAVGVHGVIIPRHRAVAVTPAVCKASAGAVEHLSVARVTNLVQTMERLKEANIWVVGLEQGPGAQDYRRVDLNIPLALVVGSEGRGLRRLVRERSDLLVQLPMRGHVGSLNASVAGSIILYRAWECRGMEERSG